MILFPQNTYSGWLGACSRRLGVDNWWWVVGACWLLAGGLFPQQATGKLVPATTGHHFADAPQFDKETKSGNDGSGSPGNVGPA